MKRVLVFNLPPAQTDKPRRLEFAGLVVALLLITAMIALSGCSTQLVTEPNYRAALVKIKSNLDEQVRPSLENMKNQDLHSEAPQHTAAWWDAKIGLVSDTAALAGDVLTAGAPAPAGK